MAPNIECLELQANNAIPVLEEYFYFDIKLSLNDIIWQIWISEWNIFKATGDKMCSQKQYYFTYPSQGKFSLFGLL